NRHRLAGPCRRRFEIRLFEPGRPEGVEQKEDADARACACAHDLAEAVGDLPWLAVIQLQRDALACRGEVLEKTIVRPVAVETQLSVIAARKLCLGEPFDRLAKQVVIGLRKITIAFNAADIRDWRSPSEVSKTDE